MPRITCEYRLVSARGEVEAEREPLLCVVGCVTVHIPARFLLIPIGIPARPRIGIVCRAPQKQRLIGIELQHRRFALTGEGPSQPAEIRHQAQPVELGRLEQVKTAQGADIRRPLYPGGQLAHTRARPVGGISRQQGHGQQADCTAQGDGRDPRAPGRGQTLDPRAVPPRRRAVLRRGEVAGDQWEQADGHTGHGADVPAESAGDDRRKHQQGHQTHRRN